MSQRIGTTERFLTGSRGAQYRISDTPRYSVCDMYWISDTVLTMQNAEERTRGDIAPDVLEVREAVAAEVRAGLGRHRVTQAALAELIGMSRPALAARLHGRQAFDVDELLVIAAHLDIPVLELIAPAERVSRVRGDIAYPNESKRSA